MSTARRFTAVSVDDVEAIDWRGMALRWHPLRGALDTRVAGLAAFSAAAVGDLVVEPHTEVDDGRGHEEIYLVLRGRARFHIDGETLDASAGTLVRVDPAAHRSAVAAEPGTWVVVIGDEPRFAPSASEWIERARPWIRSDPARAARIIDELAAWSPDDGGVVVGRALLALGRGEEPLARRLVAQVLTTHPEAQAALLADPDLGQLVG